MRTYCTESAEPNINRTTLIDFKPEFRNTANFRCDNHVPAPHTLYTSSKRRHPYRFVEHFIPQTAAMR